MVKRTLIVLLIGMVLLALLPTVGMAQERVRPRDSLLYGLGSFLIPGLGQYLNDEPGKALAHFIVAVALPTICEIVTAEILPWPFPRHRRRALCGLLSLVWHAHSAIDAYETAEEYNEMHGFALDISHWKWASSEIGQNSQF